MPFKNFHSFRVHSPDKYKDFAYKHLGGGVEAVIGIPHDKSQGSEIQAYRFPKEKFSYEQAHEWIKKHEIKTIEAEPAKKEITN